MRAIFVILILILILIISLIFIRNKTSVVPNAKGPNLASVSVSNSYIFASPVRATAGGDLIRITIFILDERGLGIEGKKIILKGDTNLNITEIQPLTDGVGKAIFDLRSNIMGAYSLEAEVDGLVLPQKVKIIFD
ncbi:hypothetical protein A2130_03260 [Candidatus Woesebacteria bacterium GWC2_33_12]|uniref:Big-1 domain-containing protein n=1 Tax=Candidatus Woesebacteria bacterium GW2011_GWB1_33_22 TaxID=1618566 RepID=A0A0F9ZJS7_9BACT|nr:MAG: hypothetical protein UR29_C0004G0017 [Candidatus Woesebacteria bacterium GW2011_GWC2_33_12]KKP41909.1 MAG: hypothetical protein UR33_C0008G0028 [Candidatus Woesebacteria bacterium GW2011_GWA2_33_20]KKP44483.1 MAG: hypothetical protein UR35_C0008G0028 [Candidatus Woesebacteria bacterium GW2011_GWB1_33_22]KKP46333.1 MAG: hypothetical protein UR37_C0009G0028 [Microgenomates group bacterium GW2011_GWC1_33_28]KKP50430.1 MAG: hypothetical protein UR41_C0008G0028 [Candidatus Woesebacteria bact